MLKRFVVLKSKYGYEIYDSLYGNFIEDILPFKNKSEADNECEKINHNPFFTANSGDYVN